MTLPAKSALIFFLIAIRVMSASAGEARIAAATSLTYALEEIAILFQRQTGHTLKLSFASSGTLTHQIMAGAPFGLFLSADSDYIDRLYQQGLTQDKGQIYARGKLVLFIPEGSSLALSSDLSSLQQRVNTSTDLKPRFAIANPELAPYGRIAKNALEAAGYWHTLSPFMVTSENASQAARFALSRAVDAALLPLSLALILKQQGRGNFVLVSEHLYQPLKQRMIVLDSADRTSRSFYLFLQQMPAQKIFAQHGFVQ